MEKSEKLCELKINQVFKNNNTASENLAAY